MATTDRKVFRLHKSGKAEDDWFNSVKIEDAQIKEIKDPNGAKISKEITSIPSPFARMDLVKNAFREVVASGDLDGNTIYHKLVSDALDVGEIFFNIDRLGTSMIEIIHWDRTKGLETLENSQEDGHHLLADTLRLYLEQDKETYNFEAMDGIYLLRYKGPDAPSPYTIIGATSPATLFFTSANDLSFVSKHISFGTDYPFDYDINDPKKLRPLYRRDRNYIKFLFSLEKYCNDNPVKVGEKSKTFDDCFPEFASYLENTDKPTCTYKLLPNTLKQEIDKLTSNDYSSNYSEIKGGVWPLKDWQLRCNNARDISHTSYFVIDSKAKMSTPPLVLPVGNCRKINSNLKNMVYITDNWDDRTYDFVQRDEILKLEYTGRTLPDSGDGIQYPYLTIDDFFEDTAILNTEGMINDKFFNGKVTVEGEQSTAKGNYILPLKHLYFRFFNVKDLNDNLEITRNGNDSLKVKLTIPVTKLSSDASIPGPKNNIIFEKKYVAKALKENDKEGKYKDCGTIEEMRFNFSIFPFTKFPKDVGPKYRMTFYDTGYNSFSGKNLIDDFNISCFIYFEKETSSNKNTGEIRNFSDGHLKDENVIPAKTFPVTEAFDYIQFSFKIGGKEEKGILIPNIKDNSGSDTFSFAVDFGTTNTHIEYKKSSDSASKPFDITKEDRQLVLINDDNLYSPTVFKSDLIPINIEDASEIHFPIRTTLSEKYNIDPLNAVPYVDVNIPFYYEKEITRTYNHIITSEIKWHNDEDTYGIKRMQLYIESLMFLIRNKVIMNGGRLCNTQIIWFYPTSMNPQQVATIGKYWKDLYEIYFCGSNDNIKNIPEALAPAIYYDIKTRGNNTVSIDIGGGTSDILFVHDSNKGINENNSIITSSRFASSNLFGDAYTQESIDTNGFVNYFYKRYTENEKIEDIKDSGNNTLDLKGILDNIMATENSDDVISFFFSLSSNNKIDKKDRDRLDFCSKLQANDKCRTLILLFYSALIYEAAIIIKANKDKGFKIPDLINFSGNGSKMLSAISQNEEILKDFTTKIMCKVIGEESAQKIKIYLNPDKPKEATCKGGIVTLTQNNIHPCYDIQDIGNIQKTWLGTDEETVLDLNSGKKYCDLTDDDYSKVEDVIKEFTNDFFELMNDPETSRKFGVIDTTTLEKYRHIFNDNIITNIKSALKSVSNQVDKISDTLFFYHITCVIHDLAYELLVKNK
jgi:hypothetical protein